MVYAVLNRERRGRTGRRGAVLILVLIVFSGLSLLAFGLCHRVRLELRMARMQGDDMRSFYLAMGGVNRAILALQEDLVQRGDDKDKDVVHFGQKWHLETTAAAEGLFEDLDDSWRASCALAYSTSDELGRLSVSKSSPAGWVNLPGMSQPIVEAILDWEDADDSANPQGAESADYMRRAYPYNAKNAPMTSVWELARVMGVDRGRLLGDLVAAAGSGADGEAGPGLIEYFTVYGDGRINLNTASGPVLACLPGIEPQDVQEILAWRMGPDRQPFTADDQHFASEEDLKRVANLRPMAAELLKEYGVFTSQYFRVISRASVRQDGPGVRLWAIIRRADKDAKLVFLTRF